MSGANEQAEQDLVPLLYGLARRAIVSSYVHIYSDILYLLIFKICNEMICFCNGRLVQSKHLFAIFNFIHQWKHPSFKVALDIGNHWCHIFTTSVARTSGIGQNGKTLADSISRYIIGSSRIYSEMILPELQEGCIIQLRQIAEVGPFGIICDVSELSILKSDGAMLWGW